MFLGGIEKHQWHEMGLFNTKSVSLFQLLYLGDIEKDHWHEMSLSNTKISFNISTFIFVEKGKKTRKVYSLVLGPNICFTPDETNL